MSLRFSVFFFFLSVLVLNLSCSSSNDEAQIFFTEYVQLMNSHDPTVTDLYSDDAKIVFYRQTADGQTFKGTFKGDKWKLAIESIMPSAEEVGDTNQYSNITFSKNGNSIKITADRYSDYKCYYDEDYYMIIKKNIEGNYLIIKEFFNTQEVSDC